MRRRWRRPLRDLFLSLPFKGAKEVAALAVNTQLDTINAPVRFINCPALRLCTPELGVGQKAVSRNSDSTGFADGGIGWRRCNLVK